MKHLVILIISIFISLSAIAQGFEFRVLANRGENYVKTKSSSEWQSLKTGSTIFSGSQLKLDNGGYVGLMHKSGKTMEIKTPKVHDIDQLSKSVMTKGSSVASQYGEYLMAKMNDSKSGDVSAEKLNNLNVTGAVSRAVGEDSDIEIFLPKTSKVLNFEDAIIKWKDIEGAESYELLVDNLYSENIASEKSENNTFDLSQLKLNLAEEGGVFLKVSGNSGELKSQPYAIEMVTGNDKDEIQKNLLKLKSELKSEDISLQKLVLAMFYEEQGLYLHAFSCYHEILAEYPEVDFYKSAYLDFVERNKEKF